MTWIHWETGDVWNSEGSYIYFLVIQMNNKKETLIGLNNYYKQYK